MAGFQFKRLDKGCCGYFTLTNQTLETILEAVMLRYRGNPTKTRFEKTRKVLEALKQEQLLAELHSIRPTRD